MYGWTERRRIRYTEEKVYRERMDERVGEWTYKRMDNKACLKKRDGWMEEWREEWKIRFTEKDEWRKG